MARIVKVSESKALKAFAEILRERMDERGLSVREAAAKAGVGYPYMYRVLKREQEPTIGWMEKVGKKLGISVEVTIR